MERLTNCQQLSLEEMLQHETLLINAIDREHRVVLWNRRCEVFFGIPKEAALGQKLEMLLPQVKKDGWLQDLERALQGQVVTPPNHHCQQRKGTYEQMVIPIRDEKGKVIAALNIVKEMD
jgi:PAS domain S-box-containing protein